MTAIIDEREELASASNAEATILCPGRPAAEAHVKEVRREDDTAGRGERIHKFLAHEIKIEEVDLRDQKLAERMLSQVQYVIEQVFGDEEMDDVYTETRFALFDENGEKVMTGKPDLFLLRGRRGLIIDYKSFYRELAPASENWQLRALAIMLRRTFVLDEITVSLVAPECFSFPSMHTYGPSDLVRHEAYLLAKLEISRLPNAPRVPGEVQCRYCRAATICPEARGTIGEVVGQFEGRKKLTGALDLDGVLEHYTGEQWDRLLTVCGMADKLIPQIAVKAKEVLAKNPNAIPGWTLQSVGNVTDIIDRVKAVSILREVFSEEEIAKLSKLSLPELKKAWSVKNKVPDRQASEEIEHMLKDVMAKIPKTPSLKRKK